MKKILFKSRKAEVIPRDLHLAHHQEVSVQDDQEDEQAQLDNLLHWDSEYQKH